MDNILDQKFAEILSTINARRQNFKQPKSRPQISTIKHNLKNLLDQLQRLQLNYEAMHRDILQLTDDEWSNKVQEFKQKKCEILNTIQMYESPENLDKFARLIKKRENKRKRLKRQKLNKQNNWADLLKRRELMHSRIDRWQHNQLLNERKIKEQLCTAAKVPQILDGIIKQKHEAKRFLSTIENLIQLRHMRKVQAGKDDRGEHYFVAEMNKLKTLWTDALNTYEEHEKQLRQQFIDKNIIIEQAWMHVLFGTDQRINGPFDGSQYDLNEFIQVRQMWDSFLVPTDHPLGSSIPIGWVIPPNSRTITSKWRVYSADVTP